MAQVRAGVDMLDEQIVTLLAKRFRFMDAAARIKQSRDQVRDEERKAAVLNNVRLKAESLRSPSREIAQVYDELVEASIAYELKRFDEG